MLTCPTTCCPKLAALPVTTTMVAAKVDWLGVTAIVEHCIHLLQTEGPTAVHLIRGILAGLQALTSGSYLGIFQALNAVTPDIQLIIAAIKAEFGI